MDIITGLGLALGVGFVSGIRCYATVFAVGLMAQMGWITLGPPFDVLGSWPIIITAGVLYLGEFLADKIQGFDTVWDGIHTFIRPIVGAMAAAAVLGPTDPEIQVIVALLGGTVAAATHATKAATRLVVNMSPEPVSNVVTSFAEEGVAMAGLGITALLPALMLGFVVLFMAGFIWMAPKVFRRIGRLFGFGKKPVPVAVQSTEQFPGLEPGK